ncbi:MAG: cytidylate kinase-like family protein, partial [Spirochaeta sp.]|nr:cytidylate kinase-like family protein [Spirochaeta sp.]
MSVITITGQVGAGEQLVAKKVAESLGYNLVDRPMIEELLTQYGIVEPEKLLDIPPQLFDGLSADKLTASDLLNSLYLVFAKRGNVVILSRRAFISLEPFLNVFTVFLKAVMSERIKSIMTEMHMDAKDAEAYIASEEERRRGIVKA